MRLMHTKLPDFIQKLTAAATTIPGKAFSIKGLENVKTTKVQSLATGRIAEEIQRISEMPEIAGIELEVIPQIPETTHSVIIKGYGPDGAPVKAIVNQVTLFHPTVETAVEGFGDFEDHRMPLAVFSQVKKTRLPGYEDIDDLSLPIAGKEGVK